MRRKAAFTFGLCLLGAASFAPAHADPHSATFRIVGTVSTICQIEFQSQAVTPGNDVVELGQVSELCNNEDGYRVIMQHPAGLQNAKIEIHGAMVPLSAGSETVIVDANEPDERIGQARLFLATGTATELPMLSFRVEPKGPIY